MVPACKVEGSFKSIKESLVRKQWGRIGKVLSRKTVHWNVLFPGSVSSTKVAPAVFLYTRICISVSFPGVTFQKADPQAISTQCSLPLLLLLPRRNSTHWWSHREIPGKTGRLLSVLTKLGTSEAGKWKKKVGMIATLNILGERTAEILSSSQIKCSAQSQREEFIKSRGWGSGSPTLSDALAM